MRRVCALLGVAAASVLGLPGLACAATQVFSYTGSAQTWTVPNGVSQATFDVYGAQGGSGGSGAQVSGGGNGAHLAATILVSSNQVLQVNVGGAGPSSTTASGGGTGGGESDVRAGTYALGDRLLVAGGGGGGGGSGYDANTSYLGGGGGTSGMDGTMGADSSHSPGAPGGKGTSSPPGGSGGAGGTGAGCDGTMGTQGSAGIGGAGGDGCTSGSDSGGTGGGGGAGYYGGGGGGGGGAATGVGESGGGGGGGSSHDESSASAVTLTDGASAGNGEVVITYTPTQGACTGSSAVRFTCWSPNTIPYNPPTGQITVDPSLAHYVPASPPPAVQPVQPKTTTSCPLVSAHKTKHRKRAKRRLRPGCTPTAQTHKKHRRKRASAHSRHPR